MNKDKLLFGSVGLILGIVLTWVFVFSAVNNQNMGMMNMMGMGSSSIMSSDNIDKHFIEQMVPHHEDAIAMADIASIKAEHPEIRQLSENIKGSQSREIEFMTKWYKDWYGKEFSLIPVASAHGHAVMEMGMMGGEADLKRLESAQPFDKAFIEEMIPHHQMAVMMAQMLQITTQRDDMKSLAHDIIDAQTAEIEQMRGWHKAWYQ
jgi:uncharacterized protein (DUF305 family)